jgi:transcriptional regulator with GAF, ATPase, and Fis domain
MTPSSDATTSETPLGELGAGLALVVRCESGAVAQLLHEGQVYTIGRGSDCAVVVNDISVSRVHAKLSFDGVWRVEDAGSRNGTTVDGRRLARGERARLAIGSAVRLGSATAVLQAAAPASRRAEGPPSQASDFADHVVRDPEMKRLYETLDVLAPSPLPVLIMGETGVGKELFASAIHVRSSRAARPMIQINCAAIPDPMLESELFGHERGAFTGATQAKPGLLEMADGGTVLLDEVGELPLALQAKLLRVLETGQCQRLGAVRPRVIDARIVSSTNRDLRQAVADGAFRPDLYHRLSGAPIRIPPLRERRTDIVPLATHFATRMAATMRRDLPVLSEDACAALESYPWPGNVRELRNVVERTVVLVRSARIAAADLQLEGVRRPSQPPLDVRETLPGDETRGLRAELDAMERRRVVEALERCGNNQSRAAKLLGISRHALIARIERFNLQRPRKGTSE